MDKDDGQRTRKKYSDVSGRFFEYEDEEARRGWGRKEGIGSERFRGRWYWYWKYSGVIV